MTKPTREQDEALETFLEQTPVEPASRYPAVTSRYPPRSRYSTASRYPPLPSRYPPRSPDPPPARADPGARTGSKTHRIFLLNPPPLGIHTGEQLLWMTSCEFENAFEDRDPEAMWRVGDVVDFGFALETMQWHRDNWGNPEDNDPIELTTMTIDSEQESYQACEFCEFEIDPPGEQALQLRREVLADPQLLVDAMDIDCRFGAAMWAGIKGIPTMEKILQELAADSTTGLGAAAVDLTIWTHPGLLGPGGGAMVEALEAADGYINIKPVENFLLYSGSLHPGTVRREGAWIKTKWLYQMTGKYAISEITYHSDPKGTVVGGWRSCWLEPVPVEGK